MENVHTYHSGSSYVRGHKWINIVLLHNKKVIPLASIPMLSKDLCKENGIEYRTEPELVAEWLERLGVNPQGYTHFTDKASDFHDVSRKRGWGQTTSLSTYSALRI